MYSLEDLMAIYLWGFEDSESGQIRYNGAFTLEEKQEYVKNLLTMTKLQENESK